MNPETSHLELVFSITLYSSVNFHCNSQRMLFILKQDSTLLSSKSLNKKCWLFPWHRTCLAHFCCSWKCSLNDNMKGHIQPSIKDAAVRSANGNLQKRLDQGIWYCWADPFLCCLISYLDQDFVALDQTETEVLIVNWWGSPVCDNTALIRSTLLARKWLRELTEVPVAQFDPRAMYIVATRQLWTGSLNAWEFNHGEQVFNVRCSRSTSTQSHKDSSWNPSTSCETSRQKLLLKWELSALGICYTYSSLIVVLAIVVSLVFKDCYLNLFSMFIPIASIHWARLYIINKIKNNNQRTRTRIANCELKFHQLCPVSVGQLCPQQHSGNYWWAKKSH